MIGEKPFYKVPPGPPQESGLETVDLSRPSQPGTPLDFMCLLLLGDYWQVKGH